MITMMNEKPLFDPACGSSKALMGRAGTGKINNILNAVMALLPKPVRQNIFLSFKYSDLTELKSGLRQTIKVFESSGKLIDGQHRRFAGWDASGLPLFDDFPQLLKLSSYGQSLVIPRIEDISSSINSDHPGFHRLPICAPAYSVGPECVEPLPRRESPFSNQVFAIHLFLRQAYKLTSIVLARMASFFKAPVLAAKKAVAERDYFVVHETHPPAAALLSSGLLVGAFQAS
jgi:hypothetical protein